MESNFVKWDGLKAIEVYVEYRLDSHEQAECLEFTLSEIEQDFNQMRGADNSLHPKWMKLNAEILDSFVGRVISNLSSRPFTVPLNRDDDEPVGTTVSVAFPHHIKNLTVRGVYETDS